jgi:creatinine amidohydrolase
MRLDERPWTDVRDADTSLALLPVGSTEQHGPHAPLGVDRMTAEAIAERAGDRHDREVVVAPTVPVGVAEEHRAFDGTLWVTEDALRAYVGDVLRSLASHGFDRVVVVNGHGGNADALREVCARVTRDGDCRAVAYTWFDDLDTDLRLGHGGPVETSAMLALRPELVREDRYPEAAEAGAESFGRFVAGTNVAYDFDEFTRSGNVGDPTPATAEEGERLLDGAAEGVCAVLDAIR